jgi:hypothetical protein
MALTNIELDANILEKVIIGNDLSSLSSIEKVKYVKNICQNIGLNPLTKPIQIMRFQGKEIPYFTKDASEQLRKLNNVSIINIDTKTLNDEVYIVTAYAKTPDGRTDSSTGVIAISNLRGEVLSNAMMKAETKAKRRVTLSICGLGFIDECEVESIPNAKKIDIYQENNVISINNDYQIDFDNMILAINKSNTLDDLKNIFILAKQKLQNKAPDLFEKIIDAKDKRKDEITTKDFIDELTGEICDESL